jgi:hypothetical protein
VSRVAAGARRPCCSGWPWMSMDGGVGVVVRPRGGGVGVRGESARVESRATSGNIGCFRLATRRHSTPWLRRCA